MRKTKQIKRKEVIYSIEEWEEIKRLAETASLKTGTYIKRISLNGKINVIDLNEVTPVMNALRIIGNNINQIAKKANEINSIYAGDIKDLKENYPESVEEIYGNATGLPRIKGAELALEQSKLQYKIQKGAALPSISFNAGYGTYYSDNQSSAFFEQFNNNRNPSMGFGLSIPIFNNWRSNTSIRNARLNVKNSEIELKLQHQNLLKDIQQAYNDALASFERLGAAKQNMEVAKESFKYTQEKFNVGMLGGTDYTVAKTNLFKAESEYLQSKFQYIFQLKVLDYYKNTPITL